MNKIFLKIKNQLKIFNDFFKINPHRQWSFLLSMFFVLVSIVILFSLYLLYEIKNEKIFQIKIVKHEKGTLLKDDLLEKITDLYKVKAEKEEEINKNQPIYSDPSF